MILLSNVEEYSKISEPTLNQNLEESDRAYLCRESFQSYSLLVE